MKHRSQLDAAIEKAWQLRDFDLGAVLILQALSLCPSENEQTRYWDQLITLVFQGHFQFIEMLLLQMQEEAPANASLYLVLGICSQQSGLPKRARFWLEQSLSLNLKLFKTHQAYLWSYLLDPELNFKARIRPFQEYGQILAHHHPQASAYQVNIDPEKKIRIGYVSSDFYDHSVVHMYAPLFALKNSQAFEVYAYATIGREGPMHEWFQNQAHCLRNIEGFSTEDAVKCIQNDKIDILVDLNGPTFGNRLDIFAAKPAPIQITGLGFGWTSGLASMDYIFTDHYLLPPELAQAVPEQPLYLSSIFHWLADQDIQNFEPHRKTRPPSPCFGAFHQVLKINHSMLTLWAEILRTIPESRLLLKDRGLDHAGAQAYYRLLFKAKGIAPERILFAGRTSQREHVQAYQSVDLVLDTFPYQAGISACEALYMGVPIISLQGGNRGAESLMHAIGHPEFLANSGQNYIDKAVKLIQDSEQLNAYRACLRKDLFNSSVSNLSEFSAECEAYYREIWRHWCSQAHKS
ncbi:hypothetical protein COW36_22750 [bacterium (Candidatus Blackallbacteria) CG17_big_fil_post_rev_8_21_14_2_50_48_46]|uniref:O-GlcNAc transferase C-terminal domain-containing protein n=1 Tax=bacterium (Candidatus Blackallbacteria) CG17_big_fil_post_rev_8_21_14_2_50_48_46 TaxID=2014261 RepID=A0A2M7FYA8_9BACT|nr:MAG: hypothetical protein COW64_07520 [bacterium (Candidatus Blackallbacteria) CG18_big_fil_WC_8_21_14_2_50_49_26]PIW14199.1 MAG: hypothetical protein COW36_22750 [bacterium (Candidatus Blackallbacteria) CG17_big_fil_post_rev_8_21_14_2_50_48_46]